MTSPFDDSNRPKEPWADSEFSNKGRSPVDRLMDAQHTMLFSDWENGEQIDKWEEWWKHHSASSEGPQKYKRGVYMDNEEPLFLMTGSEPKKGTTRSWGSIRRDTIAAPNGYEEGHHAEGPMINWTYFKQTPESWNRIKNHYLSNNEEAERPVVNMSLKSLTKGPFKSFYNRVLNNPDEETVVVNPPEVMRTFTDKVDTQEHMDEKGLPAIPTIEASKLIYDGQEEVRSVIGHPDEGYILKPTNGTGGNGIRKVENLDEAERLLTSEKGIKELIADAYDEGERDEWQQSAKEHAKNPEPFVESYAIQTMMPHSSDLRIIGFGDNVANAERRLSPDGDVRTNLSQISEWFPVPGEGVKRKLTVYGEVLNAMSQGRLEHIDLDHFDEGDKDHEVLGQGARDLYEDIVYSFKPGEYNFDSNLDQPPIKMGVDALEVDIDDIGHLPKEWRERAMEYKDGDTVYFVPELNGNPGSGADVAATLSGNPEQLTSIHCYNFMRDMAGLEPYELDEIVGNNDTSTPEGRVWSRARSYFPSDDLDKYDWIDHVSENLRPGEKEPDRPIDGDPFN